MNFEENSLVLKYFDLLDEFIRVRVLQDGQLTEISDEVLRNKSDYRQAVIRHCLPDHEEDVSSRMRRLEDDYDPMTIEDLLYQVCIDVNPALEIHQVCLPVGKGEEKEETPANSRRSSKGHPNVPWNIQTLDKTLSRRVIGQEEAIQALTKAMQKSAIGLKRPNQPVGTFFLVGRTGTGKTEIAKALTEALYDEPSRLVRIDCSEYALPHEYAKLIGSPPGYIGHSEGGYLTEGVKAKDHCVVLFDEIEKAHYKVHNLLLQILDEGVLTDSKGETVSFQNAVILLTSNLGVEEIERIRGRMGFDRDKRVKLDDIDHAEATKEALRDNFRPEFLNRIDEIIVFNPLDVDVCTRIAGSMLRDIQTLLGARGYRLKFSAGIKRHLAVNGFSEEYGARELRRLIKRQIEDLLAERILDDRILPGAELSLKMRGGKVAVEEVPQEKESLAPLS